MKKKRKDDVCHALEFAKGFAKDQDWLHNLMDCEKFMKKHADLFKKNGLIHDESESQNIARLVFMLHNWCKFKQCYSITEELAEDLFSMEDLSFPVDALHLPFPCFFLDMEAFGEQVGDTTDARLLGYYVMVDEIPYGDMMAACCSISVLGTLGNGIYTYGGVTFDYDPEHMKADLKNTVETLCKNFSEARKHITRALLFAAYLSSEQPDVSENMKQKAIYRPSERPKYTSVRKWDVGVRYMTEKQKRAAGNTVDAETGDGSDILITSAGKTTKRIPPRPHIRKAHWQTYRTGHGRTGRKVLWIAPITVGVPKGQTSNNPAIVRELKGEI